MLGDILKVFSDLSAYDGLFPNGNNNMVSTSGHSWLLNVLMSDAG
jgi:hypothetical protein